MLLLSHSYRMLEKIVRVPRCLVLTVMTSLAVLLALTFLNYQMTLTFWDNRHTCYGYLELEPMVTGLEAGGGRLEANRTKEQSFVQPVGKDEFKKISKYFLSPDLMKRGLEVIDAFAELARQENITWFICCGTLLGSYRHHQIIPWDQDYDVLVSRKDKDKLVKAYSRLDKKKFGYEHNERWTKMYHRDGWKNHAVWKFPLLDVFWTDDDDRHVRLISEHVTFTKKNIFPLTRRPFHGRMLPAPRDPRQNLAEIYSPDNGGTWAGLDTCHVANYDALKGDDKPSDDRGVSLPCAELVGYLPLVSHIRGPGGAYCREELVYRDKVLESFSRSAKGIPVC